MRRAEPCWTVPLAIALKVVGLPLPTWIIFAARMSSTILEMVLRAASLAVSFERVSSFSFSPSKWLEKTPAKIRSRTAMEIWISASVNAAWRGRRWPGLRVGRVGGWRSFMSVVSGVRRRLGKSRIRGPVGHNAVGKHPPSRKTPDGVDADHLQQRRGAERRHGGQVGGVDVVGPRHRHVED